MLSPWERLVAKRLSGEERMSRFDDHAMPGDLIGRFDFRMEHKVVLVTTKSWATRLIERNGALPKDFGVIERYGVATDAFATVLDAMLGPAKANVLYVGDLDPFDLACFRALQVGNPMLRPGRRPRYRTIYAGVCDEWLDQCERAFRRSYRLPSVCIRLADYEQQEWAALRATWPGVARVIGPRSARLLESGFKLELEGASNSGLYRSSHGAWVRRHILGRAALSRGDRPGG